MEQTLVPIKTHGGDGALPPPPEGPEGDRWDDDDLGPARRMFARALRAVQTEFEAQPWFAGLGIAGLPVECRAEPVESLGSDERFLEYSARAVRSGEAGGRGTGIVVQVIDRTPEQVRAIEVQVQRILSAINVATIPYVVVSRNLIDEALDYESAEEHRTHELGVLRSRGEITERVISIQPARHPLGPFWIIIPDAMNDSDRRALRDDIGTLVSRRFELVEERMWRSVTGGHAAENRDQESL